MNISIFILFFLIKSIYSQNLNCDKLAQDIPCMFSNIISSPIGTYNSLVKQTAYCKLQGFHTNSRISSKSPKMFQDGRVKFGVGLSHKQFGSLQEKGWMNSIEGSLTCGMCIEVLEIENMPEFNDQLTDWDYSISKKTPFIAMVFDQCKDDICKSGFLDFDIYNDLQPVSFGNIFGIKWRAVECPVLEDKLEYLICSQNTCNFSNQKRNKFINIFSRNWFSLIIRSNRIPILEVFVYNYDQTKYIKLEYKSSIGYICENFSANHNIIKLKIITYNQKEYFDIIDLSKYLDLDTTDGYNGGMLIQGNIQV